MLPAKPLTLETYHRFFLDPWNTRITVDQLNQILYMHGFAKIHRDKNKAWRTNQTSIKPPFPRCYVFPPRLCSFVTLMELYFARGRSGQAKIMDCLVGQVDLLPPRRSTLHRAALSVASPPSAAQASDDVEAIGWAECPIGCVATFAAPSADAPEPVERVPRPADFVLAGRRPRSRRTRGSAYGPRDVAAASMKSTGAPRKQAKVVIKEERVPELVSPPPPPPIWTRSPPPPPPASPPPPQDVAPPPPPPWPPPCQPQPTLAPIPAPPSWGTPMALPHPSQLLFWGLPLPTRPTAQPCPATPPPGWGVPTSFPAPFWGAPIMLPPLPPHVAWRWPPTMQLQRPPPPLMLPQPPPHFQGQPLPALIQTPPPPLLLQQPPPHLQGQPLLALPPTPPTLQHYPPPHFGGQHPPPALHQAPPPIPMQLLQRPPSH